MKFTLDHVDGCARAGMVTTERGDIPTPIFMPVGTQGSVKAVEPRELEEAGAKIILGNTYHLYLRPGLDLIEKAGGIHRLINWEGPILTDSGGYQVFSLSDLRGLDERGVQFKSHLDGSVHHFTPESVIDIQRSLGSDIMMVLDECTPYPCDESYAFESNKLTVRWADRCKTRFEETLAKYRKVQSLFAIVQGSIYPAIREESAASLVAMNFEGYAIGGLSVGEPAEMMYGITRVCTSILPDQKPRYLMGVGTPENLLECIERGIDMFDCVMPTRNGRNGTFFTHSGKLNIRNARYKEDLRPIDEDCNCYCCRSFSRGYIRHLFVAREILGLQLASIHNLSYYLTLVRNARQAILGNSFASWKHAQLIKLAANTEEIEES
jgi:queuine tRNA-ribosyltransferase